MMGSGGAGLIKPMTIQVKGLPTFNSAKLPLASTYIAMVVKGLLRAKWASETGPTIMFVFFVPGEVQL